MDVMVLPCKWMGPAKGQAGWVPVVAIHLRMDNTWHPIGGKVGDQPGMRGETLWEALRREVLEEATIETPYFEEMMGGVRRTDPITTVYRDPGGVLVHAFLWGVRVHDEMPFYNRELDKHRVTRFVTVGQLFRTTRSWVNTNLYQAAQRAVRQAIGSGREAKGDTASSRWLRGPGLER